MFYSISSLLQEETIGDQSVSVMDQGSESDAMSTRSTDSRRGEPSSPFVPVRQPPLSVNHPFSFQQPTAQPAFSSNLPGESSTRVLQRTVALSQTCEV